MPNLVGIGLSQVPTNGMLGGLAYQDPEHASIKDLDLKNLSQINSEIADTATDIFVYDTRKDSDGGAWRKRTQHTSWYNETLGTAVRGTRREFPAVAVIVAEQNFIRIYDGDDPDLPMWMVFNTIVNGASQGMADRPMIQVQNTDKIVYALNGILATGTKNESSNYGQPVINFISEKVLRMDSQGGEGGEWMGNIAQRNEAIGYRSVDYDYVIAASRVNDIAMTVLPNAPIDSATGLPVPTIAVATDDGVSVIKDDGTVVDLRGNHGGNYNKSTFVDFDSKTNAIISGFNYGSASGGVYKLAVFPIPSGDRNDDNNYNGYQHHYRRIQTGGNATIPKLAGNNITDAISAGGDGRYVIQTTDSGGNPTALNIIQEEPGTDGSSTTYPSNSRIAYATTSYNTGWMHGDIKGAFLSDTDTASVTGETIDLTNGSVPAGNTAVVANITANQLVFQSSSETVGRYDTGTTLVTGKQYHATLTISNYSGSGDLGVASGGGIDATFRYSANGTYTRYITGDDANEIQLFYRNTNTATVGLTIKEVDIDRSVNNKGLQVFGTVTKSAVATGADLVGYGPFSNSNYLEQPYNSDLDFGTGDYFFTYWMNSPSISSDQSILQQGDYAQDQGIFTLVHNSSGSGNRLLVGDESVSIVVENHEGAGWIQIFAVRRNGQVSVYRNGILHGSGSSTKNINYSSSSHNKSLVIGAMYSNGSLGFPYSGDLALFRVGASAPSAEQIKKIYEDEKVLFQENAKATLYGSSDAVTALAYDDSTNLLYAGTSSGRSEFQGLRRINNTTTAVTTAISASNGLVAEQ